MRPFPRPLGRDGKLPLLSSCADSFHAVNGHRGTVLRDNFFVNAGDALPFSAAPGMHTCEGIEGAAELQGMALHCCSLGESFRFCRYQYLS